MRFGRTTAGARAQRAQRAQRAAGARAQRERGSKRAGRTRPGRWACGLGALAGQGCALSALDLFLARFDSVLFLSQIFGHCS